MSISEDSFYCPECGASCDGSIWYRNHQGTWETKINCPGCSTGFIVQDMECEFMEDEL